MSSLYNHEEYQSSLNAFTIEIQNGNCTHRAWKLFKDVHLAITKGKCPICECKLDGTVTRETNTGNTTFICATIDHYRPQEHYPFLKCDHKNYILMCSECNQMYKKSEFPLYPSEVARGTEENFREEQPLIVNPIIDNLLELFDLVFISSEGQNLLELRIKNSLEPSNYLYHKANETIKLFGLGECETNRHDNQNVHNCRVRILQEHFGRFYELAKARKKGKLLFFKALKENPHLKEYGFAKFIHNEQFKILIH